MGTPCGCKLLSDATRILDPESRRISEEMGEQAREYWNCPGTCPDEPDEPAPLAAAALEAVANVTKAQGLKTCPRWYASQSHAHAAQRARMRRENGGLGVIAECDSALIEAVEEIDAAVSAKLEDDEERRERKREKDG